MSIPAKTANYRAAEIIFVTALITFTVTLAGLVGTADSWIGLLHPTRVKITGVGVRPDPHSPSVRLLVTSGSITNIGRGDLLWLAIRPPGDNRIYPSGRPCVTTADAKGWSCSALFGTPSPGHSALFHIIIMRANAQAVSAILNYETSVTASSIPGLAALPPGATVGDERDVPVQ